ncbi:ATP-binding protein [Phycicoccus sp.]|uniref:sensor histidine kinase n=1 Tax=Phycicoccus sp. TaxID=1902410 RepID=UPI002B61F2D8|nr:ATP-binding protein [Phycicoccus sp.]HMM94705.1 ATP-binding protein [Phycicoccus sp.]
MSAAQPGRWDGFATRLMLAQLGVLVASVVTAAAVAAAVGPRLFHEHLLRARGSLNDSQVTHVERAYLDSSLLAFGIAFVIALASAGLVTWVVARRLRRPLEDLSSAARAIAGGRYDRRVGPTGAGAELDVFARSFNEMAMRLQTTEDTRRRLLADLAHEMRTPLATCSAYLEALDDGVATWGPEASGVMAQQVTRLSRLAADLEDVSRAEEGRLTLDLRPVPVQRLLDTAVATVRPRYEDKGVSLGFRGGAGPVPTVRVDAQRLGQVLTNLLDNALRHTPAGGQVWVAAELDVDEVVVTVQDDGEGIADDQLPHVFERFYRGDTARDRTDRGSGIGLTISRAIVDAHDGSLTARSAGTGHGATLEVRLPAHRGSDG